MKTINYINEGVTDPRKLIFYLEELFRCKEHNSSRFIESKVEGELPDIIYNKDGLTEIIMEIENHKGAWVIRFYDIPPIEIIIYIVAIFESKLYYDYIDKIIFHSGHLEEFIFEEVAGTSGVNLLEIFKCYNYEDSIRKTHR